MTPLKETKKSTSSGLAERLTVTIGGREQGMVIQSTDQNKPVLLFVHGGPGMPEYFFAETYGPVLEEEFTVCYWDQRGAGLSYDAELDPASITTDLLVADTIEVTEYLCRRFNTESIYLLGHSWGSYLAIQAVQKKPALYKAYIGMAQIVNASSIEEDTYRYNFMSDQLTNNDDQKSLDKLAQYKEPRTDSQIKLNYEDYGGQIDTLLHQTGGGTRHDISSVITGIFLPIMQSRLYTLSEKNNFWKGKSMLFNETPLMNELSKTDLRQTVPELKVPIYLMHGIYDYTCPYPMAKDYFDRLKAPQKNFYTFEHSAHTPLWEEPDSFMAIVKKDILTQQ